MTINTRQYFVECILINIQFWLHCREKSWCRRLIDNYRIFLKKREQGNLNREEQYKIDYYWSNIYELHKYIRSRTTVT